MREITDGMIEDCLEGIERASGGSRVLAALKKTDGLCFYCKAVASWVDKETGHAVCAGCRDDITPSVVWDGGRRTRWQRIFGKRVW